MTSESILNLIWAALSLTALAVLGVWECRRPCGRGSLASLRRGLAFLILSVSLFFCLSASDDMVRMQALPGRSGDKTVLHLAWSLDLQENLQVAHVYQLVLALYLLVILALVTVSNYT